MHGSGWRTLSSAKSVYQFPDDRGPAGRAAQPADAAAAVWLEERRRAAQRADVQPRVCRVRRARVAAADSRAPGQDLRRAQARRSSQPRRDRRPLGENLADLPRTCDAGTKCNSKGYKTSWTGYKLHLDTIDDDLPVSAVLTSASVHDSQAVIPLAQLSAQRVTSLYDLMDSAYDAPQIHAFSRQLGHVPIIDPHPRGGDARELEPAQVARFKERSAAGAGERPVEATLRRPLGARARGGQGDVSPDVWAGGTHGDHAVCLVMLKPALAPSVLDGSTRRPPGDACHGVGAHQRKTPGGRFSVAFARFPLRFLPARLPRNGGFETPSWTRTKCSKVRPVRAAWSFP
jgi:hypothetical protein